jgi:hypothetical protein
MWENLIGRMPSGAIIICAGLTVIIPYSLNKIIENLHEYGDPPWKKKKN